MNDSSSQRRKDGEGEGGIMYCTVQSYREMEMKWRCAYAQYDWS